MRPPWAYGAPKSLVQIGLRQPDQEKTLIHDKEVIKNKIKDVDLKTIIENKNEEVDL